MKRNAGFGAVGIILIVVAVGLVGLIGWRFYSVNKSKQENIASQNSDTQSPSTPTPSSNSPAHTLMYLDIKELGIKIKLDDKTSGESYSYYVSSNGKGDGALIFNPAMKAVDAANQYCSGHNAGMIGNLQRSKDPYYFSNGERSVAVDNVTSFKLGDYYYVFAHPQSECSADTAIGEQRSSHSQDFINILKTMQLDK